MLVEVEDLALKAPAEVPASIYGAFDDNDLGVEALWSKRLELTIFPHMTCITSTTYNIVLAKS